MGRMMKELFEEEQTLAAISAEVRRRFEARHDLAHGWDHIQRVYALALYLAEQEGANRFVVGLAALMHDLGHAAEETALHHADLSVDLARQLMEAQHVPTGVQEATAHAIVAHSFSKGVEPRTLEARVVRDADRLDGLGAIGVARWAITGVTRKHTGLQLYHPEDPFAESHLLDDHRYMLDHFYQKLLTLHEHMLTTTGKALAEQRTRFMQSYLEQLRLELALTQG